MVSVRFDRGNPLPTMNAPRFLPLVDEFSYTSHISARAFGCSVSRSCDGSASAEKPAYLVPSIIRKFMGNAPP